MKTDSCDTPSDSRYCRKACRCIGCKAAHADTMRRYIERRRKTRPLQTGDPRHGTDVAYNIDGCRCMTCTEGRRLHQKELMDAKHGRIPITRFPTCDAPSRSRYTNAGCRCDGCREANGEHTRQLRASHTPPPLGDPRHGKVSTYNSYNCRCELCRTANTQASANYFHNGTYTVPPTT